MGLPILLGALGAACSPRRIPKDELVVLIEQPPASPDPRYAVEAYDFKIDRLLYAPLVSVDDPALEPKMELARSVRALDPLHWEVVLGDARFSDGHPVTAADVAFTLAALRDPAQGSRLRQRFEDDGLEKVELDGDKRLLFTLSHPHAPFQTDLDFGIFERTPDGRPVPRGALPIGAGPFVFDSRDGDTWTLRRNPYYFGGAPRIRRLIFKTIRDDNSRLLALVGGSGDLTENTVSPLLLDAVAAQPRLKVVTGRSSVYAYLGVNCRDPILKDRRVRAAIAYAIDRKTLVRDKLRGRGVAATGMLPTFLWAYSPDVETYPYDPERAKQLLDEAGYRDPDGDGPRPRFTLVYRTSNSRFRVAMAQVIAGMLARVGIGIDVRVNEWSTFFADVKKGNFQLFSMEIPEIAEPDLYTHFFDSRHIPTRTNLDAGGNRMGYVNPALDRLLDEARREMDRAKRKQIYAEVQRILAHDLPAISLWHQDNIAVMRKDVFGFELLPTAQLSSLARVYKSDAQFK